MRKNLLPVLLCTCFILALTLALGAGAANGGDDAQAVPAPAPVDLDGPVASPDPAAGLCLDPTAGALDLAKPPPPTCEECQADCDALEQHCIDHCNKSTRVCSTMCFDEWATCVNECPC